LLDSACGEELLKLLPDSEVDRIILVQLLEDFDEAFWYPKSRKDLSWHFSIDCIISSKRDRQIIAMILDHVPEEFVVPSRAATGRQKTRRGRRLCDTTCRALLDYNKIHKLTRHRHCSPNTFRTASPTSLEVRLDRWKWRFTRWRFVSRHICYRDAA
jgi:hypothetical protein